MTFDWGIKAELSWSKAAVKVGSRAPSSIQAAGGERLGVAAAAAHI